MAQPRFILRRNKCSTSAAQVRHKFGTSAAQVRHKCGTSAEHSAYRVRNAGGCAARRLLAKTPNKKHKNTPKSTKTPKRRKKTPNFFVSPSGLFADTRADPLRNGGGTGAAPVRHRCGSRAERVRNGCGTPAERVRNAGGTPAERRRICGAASSNRALLRMAGIMPYMAL